MLAYTHRKTQIKWKKLKFLEEKSKVKEEGYKTAGKKWFSINIYIRIGKKKKKGKKTEKKKTVMKYSFFDWKLKNRRRKKIWTWKVYYVYTYQKNWHIIWMNKENLNDEILFEVERSQKWDDTHWIAGTEFRNCEARYFSSQTKNFFITNIITVAWLLEQILKNAF